MLLPRRSVQEAVAASDRAKAESLIRLDMFDSSGIIGVFKQHTRCVGIPKNLTSGAVIPFTDR